MTRATSNFNFEMGTAAPQMFEHFADPVPVLFHRRRVELDKAVRIFAVVGHITRVMIEEFGTAGHDDIVWTRPISVLGIPNDVYGWMEAKDVAVGEDFFEVEDEGKWTIQTSEIISRSYLRFDCTRYDARKRDAYARI